MTPADHPARLERGHPFRQWKTWRIPGTELTLTGYSRANDKTFFHIPELRCSLDAERADRVGHTVWSQLRPVVESHPRTLFVLTHFSLRHSDPDILAFFRREWAQAGTTPPGNVLLWVHPASHLPEQHQHR